MVALYQCLLAAVHIGDSSRRVSSTGMYYFVWTAAPTMLHKQQPCFVTAVQATQAIGPEGASNTCMDSSKA